LKFTKTLDLKVLTYIITSLDIHYHKFYPIRLAAILVKMSVLTFITDVILYKTSWSWSYVSWIYNYLCNQCLSPIKFWVQTLFMAMCTRYNILRY